jgi:hypothetical protein
VAGIKVLAPLCFASFAGHARPTLHARVVRGGLRETDQVIASMSAVGTLPARWFVIARPSAIESRPVIVTSEPGGPFRRILDDALVKNRGWEFVGQVRGGQPGDLFALLDWQIESPEEAFVVVASGGRRAQPAASRRVEKAVPDGARDGSGARSRRARPKAGRPDASPRTPRALLGKAEGDQSPCSASPAHYRRLCTPFRPPRRQTFGPGHAGSFAPHAARSATTTTFTASLKLDSDPLGSQFSE